MERMIHGCFFYMDFGECILIRNKLFDNIQHNRVFGKCVTNSTRQNFKPFEWRAIVENKAM